MSDKPKENDGGSEPGSLPEPKFQSSQAQTSAVDVKAIAKAVLDELAPELDKRLQSTKDRRFQKIDDRLGAVDTALARVSQLVKDGLTIDQAQERYELESAVEYVKSIRNKEGAPVSDNPAAPAKAEKDRAMAETNQLLLDAGLVNDPEWAKIVKETTFETPQEYARTAANFVIKRAKTPNASTVITPGGGGSPPQENLDTVTAQLQAEMSRSPMNMAKVRELKAKQAALLPRK